MVIGNPSFIVDFLNYNYNLSFSWGMSQPRNSLRCWIFFDVVIWRWPRRFLQPALGSGSWRCSPRLCSGGLWEAKNSSVPRRKREMGESSKFLWRFIVGKILHQSRFEWKSSIHQPLGNLRSKGRFEREKSSIKGGFEWEHLLWRFRSLVDFPLSRLLPEGTPTFVGGFPPSAELILAEGLCHLKWQSFLPTALWLP